MRLLTELQMICRLDQVDAARVHFHAKWLPVADSLMRAGLGVKEIAAYELTEWHEWLKAHGLNES